MSQHTSRRLFLRNVGLGSLGAVAAGGLVANAGAQPPDAKILGAAGVKTTERPKGAWKPVSDRKIRSASSAMAFASSARHSASRTIPTSRWWP